MPTISWTINEGDLIRCKREVELSKIYRDAYLIWENFYDDSELQRFGLSPIRHAYWRFEGSKRTKGLYTWEGKVVYTKKKPLIDPKMLTNPIPKYIHDMFGKKTPKHNGATMVFRRFPALSVPEYEFDILVKSLLEFPHPMGYKKGNNNKILNDSWMVNLRSTEKENIMMDSFLRGFSGQSEDLKNAWNDKQSIEIDVGSELKELLSIYQDAEKHLIIKEQQALDNFNIYMKLYLDSQQERKKITAKLESLTKKISDTENNEEDQDE